jgi:hypothetical protein
MSLRSAVLIGLLAAVLPSSGLLANDFNFDLIHTKIFPVNGGLSYYTVADINNDSLDELIVAYPTGYFIYSFQTDSVIFQDTGIYVREGCVTDFDGDQVKDFLYIADVGKKFYMQSGIFTTGRQFLCSPFTHFYASEFGQGTKYGIGIDHNSLSGHNSVIFVRQVGGVIDWVGPIYQAWESGEIFGLDAADWSELWGTYPYLSGFIEAPAVTGQHSLFLDLNSDGHDEVITWGKYFFESYLYDPDTDKYTIYFVRIVAANGQYMGSKTVSNNTRIIGGPINPAIIGNALIMNRSSGTPDSAVYFPTGPNSLFCMQLDGASFKTIWGVDAGNYNGSYDGSLFYLPSIVGSFCIPGNGKSYQLRSGIDGQQIGKILGLDSGVVTLEGRFLSTSQEHMTVVQLKGAQAKLFQLASITGTGSNDNPALPQDFSLEQNFPNPFNGSTQIYYTLTHQSDVDLSIFNLLGQKVATLIHGRQESGRHTASWDGSDASYSIMPSGIYLYRLSVDNATIAKKMVLIK